MASHRADMLHRSLLLNRRDQYGKLLKTLQKDFRFFRCFLTYAGAAHPQCWINLYCLGCEITLPTLLSVFHLGKVKHAM